MRNVPLLKALFPILGAGNPSVRLMVLYIPCFFIDPTDTKSGVTPFRRNYNQVHFRLIRV
jgi:hypothetical protein